MHKHEHSLGASTVAALIATSLLLFTASCGAGGEGGVEAAGQGLVLTNFYQAGQDNLPINRILRFAFSEAVDAASVTPASIQIRQGDNFGLTAQGKFRVDGSTVYFEPRLPTLCGGADAGFLPATTYRVTLLGFPEAFSVKNAHGQPLEATGTYEFTTRPDTDPGYLEDQIPAASPVVTSVTPGQSEAAVTVEPGNVVSILFSENLDPCSVNPSNVRFLMYEIGESGVKNAVPAGQPNEGNVTGFTPWDDQLPDDPTSWGPSGTPLTPPQVIPAALDLIQDFSSTELQIRPGFGRFPENALCVIELTFNVVDFGGSPLVPVRYSFTTENLDPQTSSLRVEFEQDSESWPMSDRTIDVDSDRSPGLLQAWMLFSGDGDNGTSILTPSRPGLPSGGCIGERQPNDGNMDDFDPATDVLLDTGATPNTCANSVDGSTAVVWEFRSFRIRTGITVRVVGVNPAIILVQGDAMIESNGILRTRADGSSGMPQGRGQTGYSWTSYSTSVMKGGEGVAGAGNGGDAVQFNTANYGGDGWSAYGSDDGWTVLAGEGAGLGGSIHLTVYPSSPGTSQGGGGGGHAVPGTTSTNVLGSGHTDKAGTRGDGGSAYPTGPGATKMLTPSSGAGGGAGGNEEWTASYAGVYSTGGGGGGAGGGFIDITSSGNIYVYGTIDAAGSAGGNGGSSSYYAGPGGGGGGAGGGIRLITSGSIVLTPNSVITAAGGAGGTSPNGSSGSGGPQNHGGPGGHGRVVLEDQDSVIEGMVGAQVVPGEGQEGFYRGPFDSTRFKGGGLSGKAVSGPILVGPLSPVSFQTPVAADFKCVIPANASIPPNGTSILVEAAGYPIKPDGTVDLTVGDHWYTIGYFATSGAPNDPNWTAGSNPPDVVVTNDGAGINLLNGSYFLRFRVNTRMPDTVAPTTPGPYMDWMEFRFTYNQ